MAKDIFKPVTGKETTVPALGTANIDSPLSYKRFVDEDDAVQVEIYRKALAGKGPHAMFEHAGPRKKIFFDPSKTKCAVVTCGGLCPGINNVIRSMVYEAFYNYGVTTFFGIRYGLQGFIPQYGHDVLELNPDNVTHIHQFGGTMLGTSRGPQSAEEIVDALERMSISCLFMIGGDGTMHAAAALVDEVKKRKLKISIIGIPKTIDNDIGFVAKTFGFDTAVEKAAEAIQCAHTEALGAPGGMGLVKVMGRNAGYIAAEATLASGDVNFVLIPEADFDFQGEHGLLAALEERLKRKGHAVIVVAEGAGQNLTELTGQTDPSGNPVLGDVAKVLIREIKAHFSELGMDTTLKYIDPSYIIRSVPANSTDRIYCGFLGAHSVHAAMSGRTAMMVGIWNGRYVNIPLTLATRGKKCINTNSNYWRNVLETTGQPPLRAGEPKKSE